MKRDKEYLRELLLRLQNERTGFILHVSVLNPSDEDLKLGHHLELLMDEGLVVRTGTNGYRLTSLGHDAVEAIGSNETWNKIKGAAPKEAYELVKNLGSSVAVAALSKLMGWG